MKRFAYQVILSDEGYRLHQVDSFVHETVGNATIPWVFKVISDPSAISINKKLKSDKVQNISGKLDWHFKETH